MLGWLKSRSLRRRSGQQLYERIVAQSRDPALYLECGVPDTMDGRLEMLLLHTVLTLDRLRDEGPAGQGLGQHVMELLVADTDDALRRIGLGDDSVSPRIQKLGAAIAERTRDYRAALAGWTTASPADPLESTLLEHVYGVGTTTIADPAASGARLLAAYTPRPQFELGRVPSPDFLAGELAFPPILPLTGRAMERPA